MPSESTDLPSVEKLAVEHLDVYYGAFQAIKDASLSVGENCVMAFIGPSGCGKSTFLRALNRMHDLTPGARVQGHVRLDGEDIYATGTDPVFIRHRIGMVFQRPNPFPKSVFENVVYGPRIHGIRNRKQLMDICERSLRRAALW
ncbi:MAG: phosphate ABC transporter ATP-binding protein, partial [Vulcanimicrobiaceae bacterium]